MRDLPVRNAVRSGNEVADIRKVLSAVARLALFHDSRIPLARTEVDDLTAVLVDFLAEVNDASPKI